MHVCLRACVCAHVCVCVLCVCVCVCVCVCAAVNFVSSQLLLRAHENGTASCLA